MMRPKWLQPRIGRGHRGNGEELRKNRQAEVRKDQPDQGGLQGNPADGRQGRAGDTQPRTSSFRQEMRAARLRQEEARKQAEANAQEREKIRQEAQAYIYGRTEAQEAQALEDRAAGRETFRSRQGQQEQHHPEDALYRGIPGQGRSRAVGHIPFSRHPALPEDDARCGDSLFQEILRCFGIQKLSVVRRRRRIRFKCS